MRIDILHVTACPNLERALTRVRTALATGRHTDAAVHITEVATAEHAERAGMHGSPTILVDGRDPFADHSDTSSLSCRLYQTDRGIDGAPSVAQLRRAIEAAALWRFTDPDLQTRPTKSEIPRRLDGAMSKAAAARAASEPARRLHIAALTICANHGHPPDRRQLERLAERHAADPRRAIAELIERDLIAVDDTGEVRAIYPFSTSRTAIEVTWADRTSYAMCAIDAIGVSAMLGHPVTITSHEPGTACIISIHVDGDKARWDPPTAVVFAGTNRDVCCPSADRTCRYINFFTTHRNAQAWAARHPDITGDILSQVDALAVGVDEFGSLLTHDTVPGSPVV